MSKYVENPIHFAADCVQTSGQCAVLRDNIVFLDQGNDLAAIDLLQRKCGTVAIMPDASNTAQAVLYRTSCDRMTDLVEQLFEHHLQDPTTFAQPASEMMVGELHRQSVTLSYDECKARVAGFNF